MKKIILIAEDEAIVRFYLNTVINKLNGFSVLQAKNGEEALNLFKEHGADAILTDIFMEPMNGIELIKHIREIDSDIPIIVMSAYLKSMHEDLDVQGYLKKPIDLNVLESLLSNLFKKGPDS